MDTLSNTDRVAYLTMQAEAIAFHPEDGGDEELRVAAITSTLMHLLQSRLKACHAQADRIRDAIVMGRLESFCDEEMAQALAGASMRGDKRFS